MHSMYCNMYQIHDPSGLYFQLPRTGALSVPVICAALDLHIYYCAGGIAGAPNGNYVAFNAWPATKLFF